MTHNIMLQAKRRHNERRKFNLGEWGKASRRCWRESHGGSSEFQNHICQDTPEIVKVLYFLFMSERTVHYKLLYC